MSPYEFGDDPQKVKAILDRYVFIIFV